MGYRWLGAALLIAGCGGVGFRMASGEGKALRELRWLIRVLDFMENELTYRMNPLPQLCSVAAEHAGGEIRAVFCRLAAELESQISPNAACCMVAAISACPGLSRQAEEALTSLGRGLGQFDLPGQLNGIAGVRHDCQRLIEVLEKDRPQRLRSYRTLALCAGAALAILFI